MDNLASELYFLAGAALLKAALDHATAMLLLANLYAVLDARFEDELGVLFEKFAAGGVGV